MKDSAYQSYEEAAAAYLAEFDALMQAPARAMGPRTARAAAAPAGELVERAESIAGISQAMVPLAQARLEGDDAATREGLSAQLAAQAAAEFQLAAELLQLVESDAATRDAAGTGGGGQRAAAAPARGEGASEPPTAEEAETARSMRENPEEMGSDEAGPTADGAGVALAGAEDAGPSMRVAGLAGPTPAEASTATPASAVSEPRQAPMRDVVRSLHRAMDAPPARALAPSGAPRREAAALPGGIAEAKAALREAAVAAATAISDKARELGGAVAVDLITQTEWRAVVSGAAMVNKQVAATLESVKKGVGALIQRAVAAATRTLLNVYDKLLALLGKDAEDAGRVKVKGWLEQIKQEGKFDLLGTLMGRLYRLDEFPNALDEWLGQAPGDAAKVNQATSAVQEVAPRFVTLAGYLKTVEDVAVLAKRFLKLPQALAIAAGVQVLLLAVVVYSGYDYIGYRELKFPNLARGVAQVVREGLVA